MNNNSSKDPSEAKNLTLKSGAPIGDKISSLLVGPKGPHLLTDVAFVEEAAHFNRERIPERVVHAKGAAAYGEFVLTSNEISQFCKADLFKVKGKKTPIVARFSHVAGESGVADTERDVRGFAVKFYTEQGNWDLVGNNLPVFFVRDPINFVSLIHSQKRNPKTHLKDPDAFWDFISMMPESLHTTMMLFSDRGVPDGFRHMHGYGVNTFKLVNTKQDPFFAKFHWICQQPIRNLDEEASKKVAGIDPDYAIRDLQSSITNGQCPSWVLHFQVMSVAEAAQLSFNPFDVTKTWPQKEYPLREIGRMTLNRNPENYFAEVEQLAFSPANMIPGIEPSPDRVLMGRILAYPDAQRYRMGVNYTDLPCNKPKCPFFTPTYCDGVTSERDFNASQPNYVPSIKFSHKNRTLRNDQFLEHKQHFSGHQARFDLSQEDNYSQARKFITKVLDEAARKRLVSNISKHLSLVTRKDIISQVIVQLQQIEATFGQEVDTSVQRQRRQKSPKSQ